MPPPPHQYNTKLIPEPLARAVAKRVSIDFLHQQPTASRTDTLTPSNFPDRPILNEVTLRDEHDNPALYVYNYDDGGGFIIISADARHEPVCALVEQGKFQADTVPAGLVMWFEATMENIEMVRTDHYDNTARANYAWNELLQRTELTALNEAMRPMPVDPEPPGCDEGWIDVVRGPLLPCTWGQECTYNEQCDDKSCTNLGCITNTKALTGCVATAMSQIIRYWQVPTPYSFTFAGMPNNRGNSEVQRLMHEVGKAVDMNYGCDESSTPMNKADNAFRNTFNYGTASFGSYNASSYLTVKNNIAGGKPVMLDGCRTRTNIFLGMLHPYGSCHAWVCDGYWSKQNQCYGFLQFHMNWGWHEIFNTNDFNGWYVYNQWNANNRNYQYSNDYVSNIHP